MSLLITLRNSTLWSNRLKNTKFFKEQQVNQVNQSSSRPANANDKSRQNITRFCPYSRKNGHTLMYCRTKAHDDEIKRQRTRNNQECWTVLTPEYKKRGPEFGMQNPQNLNQQPRYGNQNIQKPHYQNRFDPDPATLGKTDQMAGSKLSVSPKLDQRFPKLRLTEIFHTATTYHDPIHFNLSLTLIQI